MSQTAFKKVANNAISTVDTDLTSSGVTSISIHTGDGSRFPASGSFRLDLWNGASTADPTSDDNYEQVIASARSTDAITISATTKTHTAACNVMLPQDAADIGDLQTAVGHLEDGTNLPYGVTANTAAQGNDSRITGAATAANLTAETTRAQAAEIAKVQIGGDLGGTITAPTVIGTHLASPLPIAQGGTGSGTQNFVDLTTAQVKAGGLTVPLTDKGGQVFNVKAYGATGNGTTDDSASILSAITAAQAVGGIVFFPTGTYKVISSSRTDTISYRSGNTFNDSSCVSGDVGKYVLWGNLGRIAKITAVAAGSYFTVDVLPLTTAATSAAIVVPGLVIPEGVRVVGAGPSFNHQLTAGGATSQVCTQISDTGTGVTVLIQGANSSSGGSTRYGLSNLSVIGNSGNTYGLFVGNGAWLIDSENLELSNHGIAGLGLDGNINSHSFKNLVLYGNGNAAAATPTGGVITHPYNAGGSSSCNFYNPFFSSDYGFGICDGDANGSYGVNLWAPQFNSIQASAMANSGTSMVLQSKGTGDGMATVVGGWSETAALYDVISSGYVTIVGMRMHSAHAYHWVVTGGIANAIGCTFEGATTYAANLTGGGILLWSAIKSTDPGLYAGAPATIPSIGSSSTLFANALQAKGVTVDGNLVLEDAATPTKSYRFRTSGASLDFDFAGAQLFLSGYSNADFTGTQKFYLGMDTGGNLDAFSVWRFHDAPFGTTKLTIDSGASLITLGDAVNLAVDTTTGTKIGTSTTQKLAFYNSTPVVQPTGDILAALSTVGLIASPVLGAASSLSSGSANLLTIAPTITQTGTAGFTGVLVNVTETSHGSGTRLLQDWQTGGATQMSISDAGVLKVGGVDITFTLGLKAPLDAPTFTTSVTLTDAINVVLGSTTGTKFGTAITQKLGFYNATPVVQRAAAAQAAAPAGGTGATAGAYDTSAHRDSMIALVNEMRTVLVNLGLMKGSA